MRLMPLHVGFSGKSGGQYLDEYHYAALPRYLLRQISLGRRVPFLQNNQRRGFFRIVCAIFDTSEIYGPSSQITAKNLPTFLDDALVISRHRLCCSCARLCYIAG